MGRFSAMKHIKPFYIQLIEDLLYDNLMNKCNGSSTRHFERGNELTLCKEEG